MTPIDEAALKAGISDSEIMEIADRWFHTGENQHRADGYYYRSLGTPTNVRGSDLIAFARALLSSHHEDGGRADTSELEQMRARKDAAYLERNQVVAALAKCFPSGVARTAIEGWSEDWHGCAYIDLPTGQASWHFHDSHAYLFDSLPPYTGTWDGHDTPEKYARLAKLGVALGGEKGEAVYPTHPQFVAGFKAGHDAGRKRGQSDAAPVGKARMLTRDEFDAIWMPWAPFTEFATAIQRKFCEVNGITLQGGA